MSALSPTDWLHLTRGEAPLVVSIPHAGTIIPSDVEARLVSPWLARKDADWWLGELYAFADGLDATVVRTGVSRTVIDVNRDPSGVSLYPGQATTSLCPVDTFDGEPLYQSGQEPDAAEIARRRMTFFDPYHDALEAELDRLLARHGKVVLYDAHSIRSRAPRLFDGELPQFNIGTNSGAACDPGLAARVEAACDATGLPRVTDGRFKGGWITRRYGRPDQGVHAVQMELACRGYIDEPAALTAETWPTPYAAARAAPLRAALSDVLKACLAFAQA
ncbi:N-formylglutamate deformylase [Caulobacter sp. CCG-8]|uniref:N-formylglutamate deformylase n=1 Tax=Caulobacter sp. CCG-8 TaxID=3127958 RepID=UPI00307CD033